jgi:AAA15 family ATPase/GTPase
MITKLKLENWRVIKRGVIEWFQRINVGRNNSGKSSVLEAMLTFERIVPPPKTSSPVSAS